MNNIDFGSNHHLTFLLTTILSFGSKAIQRRSDRRPTQTKDLFASFEGSVGDRQSFYKFGFPTAAVRWNLFRLKRVNCPLPFTETTV